MTEYLIAADILAIHADLIERYGGTHGIRDMGALEAALYRPQSGYYSDTIEQAAALWESLNQNHVFIDGNKRIAFAACYTFLVMNGFDITAHQDSIYKFIMKGIEAQTFKYENICAWLRKNTVPI